MTVNIMDTAEEARAAQMSSPSSWMIRILGITVFLVFWLVVLSFKDFFFFNPWGAGDFWRSFTLTLTTLGWVLLATAPVIILWLYSVGQRLAIRWLPLIALWWPISLLISHITVYLQDGQWYFNYLVDYPIFLFTDILLPLIMLGVWWILSPAAEADLEGMVTAAQRDSTSREAESDPAYKAR